MNLVKIEISIIWRIKIYEKVDFSILYFVGLWNINEIDTKLSFLLIYIIFLSLNILFNYNIECLILSYSCMFGYFMIFKIYPKKKNSPSKY